MAAFIELEEISQEGEGRQPILINVDHISLVTSKVASEPEGPTVIWLAQASRLDVDVEDHSDPVGVNYVSQSYAEVAQLLVSAAAVVRGRPKAKP